MSERVIITRRFWILTTERALKSAGQLGGAYLGATALPSGVGFSADFTVVGLLLALAFGILSSVALSLASAPIGEADTPHAVRAPQGK